MDDIQSHYSNIYIQFIIGSYGIYISLVCIYIALIYIIYVCSELLFSLRSINGFQHLQ